MQWAPRQNVNVTYWSRLDFLLYLFRYHRPVDRGWLSYDVYHGPLFLSFADN